MSVKSLIKVDPIACGLIRTGAEMPMFAPCKEMKKQRLMTTSERIYLMMDVGCRVAAFTAKREMRAYLKRRLGTFTNPLVYAFGQNRAYTPTVMTMSSPLAEV
jgi:hypothetical protein